MAVISFPRLSNSKIGLPLSNVLTDLNLKFQRTCLNFEIEMPSKYPQLETSDDVANGCVQPVHVDGPLFVGHHKVVDVALNVRLIADVHRRRRFPLPGTLVDATLIRF